MSRAKEVTCLMKAPTVMVLANTSMGLKPAKAPGGWFVVVARTPASLLSVAFSERTAAQKVCDGSRGTGLRLVSAKAWNAKYAPEAP